MRTSLLLTVLLAATTTAWPQIVQWPTAQGGNDHYYEVIPAPDGITWSQASLSATNRGGFLASITSSVENDFVFSLASGYSNAWYGGYGPWLGGVQAVGSTEPGAGWGWVTGETFSFQNWGAGQPNNSGGAEDRIQFGGSASISKVWNDLPQNLTNFSRGYVVEYSQHPNATVLNFESINGTTPCEGMSISNQFAAQFGISFRRTDGGFPVIARKGAPQAVFNVSNLTPTLYDEVRPSDPRVNEFGDFFLGDDAIPGNGHTVIMHFSSPVSRVSGFVFDVDGADEVTFTAYSDDGTNAVGQFVLTKDSPEAGEGLSTPWIFVRPTADIQQIRFNATSCGFDNFISSYRPPAPQPASLDVNLFAGVTIQGDVGRPYRIDSAERLTPTNWITRTNLLLPSSPYTYIDQSSTHATQRFYRVVAP